MPNNYDFNKLTNIKEIKINPKGWILNIIVEYGIGYHGEDISYFWRVKGTKHTFVIPILRMDYLTEGNYNAHFEEVLESFREDYKKWKKEEWYLEWQREYYEDFSQFIL